MTVIAPDPVVSVLVLRERPGNVMRSLTLAYPGAVGLGICELLLRRLHKRRPDVCSNVGAQHRGSGREGEMRSKRTRIGPGVG